MNKITQFVIAGALIGLFLGSSTGVAMQGTAYNGAVVFGPLGALIGWLIASNRSEKIEDSPPKDESEEQTENEANVATDIGKNAANVFSSMLAILATIWNFHIDLLEAIGLLPIFCEKPWLFFVTAVVLSFFFPPFLAIYFVCYLGASHFGVNSENKYRVAINRV